MTGHPCMLTLNPLPLALPPALFPTLPLPSGTSLMVGPAEDVKMIAEVRSWGGREGRREGGKEGGKREKRKKSSFDVSPHAYLSSLPPSFPSALPPSLPPPLPRPVHGRGLQLLGRRLGAGRLHEPRHPFAF